ncbi:hypothetical protein DNTS_004417 [Danionella cerebrum]|uniref:Protein AAR2 homolog n=1 Tax=Danionella cerebrum TaxID=2873325 RepID=A0A553NH97_9TELE|nr:hypothetical protein DNTS_004417 [Danionella translucida]
MADLDMDPEVALGLFEEGATLVLLGVPEGMELGLDYKTWTLGPRFRGVKMIPPGLHFLHYCSINTAAGCGEISPKTGLFLNLKSREVLVAHWNQSEEDLEISQDPEEVERMRSNLKELDRYLGPYPYDTLRKWVSLTDRLRADVALMLQPLNGRVCSFSEVLPEQQMTYTSDRASQSLCHEECKSLKEGMERLPRMKQREGTELRFSNIPKQSFPPGATPAQITQCSMDRSYTLDCLIQSRYSAHPLDVLGELQFAFVCFLLGNVYEGFEHWQKLLALLCRCEDALQRQPQLFLGLIGVLFHQLPEIPQDFFIDIVSKNNFLTSTLQEFFQVASAPGVDSTLKKRAEKFKVYLTRTFRWDFEADQDDCAPVVVELPEGINFD